MSNTTRFPVIVGDREYLVAPDDVTPEGMRTCAIVGGRVIDELTLLPVSGPITVQPAGAAFASARTRRAVNPRATDGGIVGLAGVPTRALPMLGGVQYEVGVTVRASGYVEATLAQFIGPIIDYPNVFVPLDLGDIVLHRQPVMLFGRAMERGATSTIALDQAHIDVTGVWRTAPTVTSSPPPAAANIIAIDPPLAANRATTADVNARTLTPDALAEKRLQRPAVAGATTIALSDRISLGPNGILGIDEADPMRVEWVRVLTITGGSSPNDPAVATLAHPLLRSHAVGALAHPTTIGAVTASEQLTLDGTRGDATLFLGALGAFATGMTIEIDDGSGDLEYHTLSLYRATSDVDGQWRLPPLSRVSQIQLTASHATATPPPQWNASVEYPRREQRIDVVFT